ncbi:hypothetical protein [Aeoliella sp. SH292]|uniref:hypothetical protein n=1 Tax=Aeoliella sp. SH292 TaxID=3454464 RepID=UPI003F97A649
MKSEERHELEQNTLAKLLEQGSDKAAPYASYIIYGLLAVAAIWAVFRLTSSNIVAKKDAAWDAYTMAVYPFPADTEALRATADEYKGKEVGEFAELAWADSQLAQGCREYFSDKKGSMEALDNALKQYEDAAKRVKNPVVRSRAQLGVAKATEAKGDIAAAIEAYNKVTGVYSELADSRVKVLEEWNSQDVASWLATAEGASRPSGVPGAGAMPQFTPDGLDLPSTDPAANTDAAAEDFFKTLDQFQKIAPGEPNSDRYENKSEPAAEGATTEIPAEGEPTTETPAVETPAGETPAEEAPATDTPAESAPAEGTESATDAETPAATQPE